MKTLIYCMLWTLFLSTSALDMRQCNKALGMESGRIKDEQLTASSVFDPESTSPQHSRLNSDEGSGAWCPLYQINETSHEHLQIEFPEDVVVSGIETQGRFDRGRGMEYPTGYMVEYWRTSLGRWARYKDSRGNEIIEGNTDTRTAVLRQLDGAIIAKTIRIIPVSQVTRTMCLRVELHGCSLRSSLASYSAPVGSRFDGLDLRDSSYDGDERDNGVLVNGIGKLFDGVTGEDNFERYPEAWVGWHKDAVHAGSVSLEFTFTERRNFSSISLHCSNARKAGAGLFSDARVYFSTSDDDLYSSRVVQFEQLPDDVFEASSWVRISVNYRLAKKIRVEVFFGELSDWLLVSEVKFESSNAVRIHPGVEDDSVSDRAGVGVGVSAVEDHAQFFFFVLVVVVLILGVILLTICKLNARLNRSQSPHLPLKAASERGHQMGYFDLFHKCPSYPESVATTKRYVHTPERLIRGAYDLNGPREDEYADPDLGCFDVEASLIQNPIYNLPADVLYPLSSPSSISDQNEDIYEPLKVDKRDLKFVKNIGSGEFGTVDVHELHGELVAVKALKSTAGALEDSFKKEIYLMSQMRHQNVVQIVGISADSNPVLCITEFLQNGDLRQFMQRQTAPLTCDELLTLSFQISAGMAYLESRKFIHRDLAARNCFVDRDGTVKIGDFGMARSLYGADYYKIDGQFALPIRWMAPESVFEGRFSHKSDVWSLAVTLWELFSGCRDKPFSHLPDAGVIQNLQHSIHNSTLKEYLCRPHQCPMAVYTEVMLQCWRRNEAERPSLGSVHKFFQSIQTTPATTLCRPPPPNRTPPDTPTI